MGTLGAYLRSAREARGLDIREVAQQTRISISYLRALEDENFAKLPGEVFIKGFLKNYARFLNLSEAEILKRYAETKPPVGPAPAVAASSTPQAPAPAQAPAAEAQREAEATAAGPDAESKTPIEPFLWGVVILVALLAFIFTTLPASKHPQEEQPAPAPSEAAAPGEPGVLSSPSETAAPEKLYLDITALEDTWVLVRTDSSPQKKAVLKKGETVTWSADERFLLSYASVDAAKLMLNGRELTVQGPQKAVVRDLAITASGIVLQKIEAEQPKPRRPKPQVQTQQTATPQPPAAQAPPPPQPAPAAPQPAPAPVAPIPAPTE